MAHNDREAQARYEQKKVDDRARMNIPEEMFSYIPGAMGPPKVLADALEHNLKPGWGKRLGERADDLSWDLGEAQYGLGKLFNNDSPPQPSHQEKLAEGLSPQEQQLMGYHYQSRYGDGKTLTNDDGSMTTVLSTGVNDPNNQYTISLPGFNNKTGELIGEGMSQEDRDWAIYQHAVKRFAPEFTLLSQREQAANKLARIFPSYKVIKGEDQVERRAKINADSQRLHKRIEEDDRANRDADQWQQHKAANTAIKRNIADRTGGPIQNLSLGDAAKNHAGAADWALRMFGMMPENTPPNLRAGLAGLGSEGLGQLHQFIDLMRDKDLKDYQYDTAGNTAGVREALRDPDTYPRTPEGLATKGLEYASRPQQATKDGRGLSRKFLAF